MLHPTLIYQTTPHLALVPVVCLFIVPLLIVLPSRAQGVVESVHDGVTRFLSAVGSGRAFAVHNVKLVVIELGLAHHLKVPADAARLAEGFADELLKGDR